MINCINTNSAQYRELKKLSTLPDILLKAEIARYQSNHNGRFPKIDEIFGANSHNAIKEDLNIKEDNCTKIENILNFTGVKDLNEATIIINDKYRDLDTEIIPINKTAMLNIKDRPSVYKYVKSPQNDFEFVDSQIFITEALDKMAKTLGVNIKYLSTTSLKQNGILDKIPDAAQAQAFVYNNDIYVNTDLASTDSKIHELMHILLGSIRFKEPNLYFELVQSIQELPNLEEFSIKYPNRTQSDLLEEVFVDQYSKYLSGMKNEMSNLDPDIIYQINYNINRTLDTILMGDNSVSAIDNKTLYNSSLKDIAKIVNSSTMVNTSYGYLNDALIHRTLANVKQELLENGDLKEEC